LGEHPETAMLIIFWILCGFFASVVAGNKGYNGLLWWLGGYLLGPLALLATLGLSDKNAQTKQDELLEETRRHNEWMRRKMNEAEEERRYYEERRFEDKWGFLPEKRYSNEEEYDGGYEDVAIDVKATDDRSGEAEEDRGTEPDDDYDKDEKKEPK